MPKSDKLERSTVSLVYVSSANEASQYLKAFGLSPA